MVSAPCGIGFVLKRDIPWKMLWQESGYGSDNQPSFLTLVGAMLSLRFLLRRLHAYPCADTTSPWRVQDASARATKASATSSG
ncbi:hypothetical protein FH063_001140 [Azospirillum argentinense]|uniref:Uncharacterized protein n=1 Tax=Azospirillum argentinense TaxID=2970906 RepID=A0A5B0L583_9PROT|nr:hypothetical protein FH063_001140 [Azospirillum argentinense]